jgi:hypothetical protein
MMKTLEVFRALENDYTVDCPEQDFSNASLGSWWARK